MIKKLKNFFRRWWGRLVLVFSFIGLLVAAIPTWYPIAKEAFEYFFSSSFKATVISIWGPANIYCNVGPEGFTKISLDLIAFRSRFKTLTEGSTAP